MSATTAAAPGATAPSAQTTTTVAIAILGVFVTYLPLTGVSLALATIGRATGADTTGLQWVQDAYVIAMAAAVLSAGVFGDLYGRRAVFLAGMGLTVVGGVVATLSGTLGGDATVGLLWASQAVSGLGGGLLMPTTLALIAHVVPDPRARGKYVGLWATGMVSALAVGPLLTAIVMETAGWAWIWAPNAALAVVVGLAARLVPESKASEGRHLDWPGQISATIAIVASIYGIICGGADGWTSPRATAGIVIGIVALVTFVVIERRTQAPLIRLDLFKSAQFSAAGFAALVALFSVVGAMFLLCLFLGFVQELSPLEIAVRLLCQCALSALLNPVVGALMHKVKATYVLTAGLGLGAIAVGLLAGVEADTGFLDLIWRMLLFGVAMALMFTSVSTAAINAVPWQLAGMAAATNTALRQYGGALGPAVLGAVYTSQIAQGATPAAALHTALMLDAVLLAVAAIACLVACRR